MSEVVGFGFARDGVCDGWSDLGLVGPGLVWLGQGRVRAVRSGQVLSQVGQGCSEVVCSGLSIVGGNDVQ